MLTEGAGFLGQRQKTFIAWGTADSMSSMFALGPLNNQVPQKWCGGPPLVAVHTVGLRHSQEFQGLINPVS